MIFGIHIKCDVINIFQSHMTSAIHMIIQKASMKVFTQTSVSVYKLKRLLKYYYHLKGSKNCVGGFVSKMKTIWFL
jgi:hypothetical protein